MDFSKDEWIESTRKIVLQYCLRITGISGEAEDLAQEVMIKLIMLRKSHPEKPFTKAFIYRIASNLWIDEQRKSKLQTEPLNDTLNQITYKRTDDLLENIELLAHRLPAKYLVVLLLMDGFEFTAKETATLLCENTNVIYVNLYRARAKLKEAASQQFLSTDVRVNKEQYILNMKLLDPIVEAFRRGDPSLIYREYLGLINKGIHIRTIKIVDGQYCFYINDPSGNMIMLMTK